MAKKLDDKRDAFLKKLKKLGKELRALDDYHRRQTDKLKAKSASYEAKLKKIDDRMRDI